VLQAADLMTERLLKNIWLRRIVALSVCAYPVFDFVKYAARIPNQRLIDLFVRYVAARLLQSHGDLYSLHAQRVMADQIGGVHYGTAFSSLLLGYTHPVSDTVFDLRYLLFQFPVARWAYTVESVALYVASLLLVWHALKRLTPHVLHWVFPVLLFALFPPTRSSLGLGQSDITIFFLMTLLLWAYTRDRRLIAGIAAGIATLTKLIPGLLILYWVWKREWQLAIYSLATAVAIVLATLPFVGLPVWIQFLTQVFPALSTGTAYANNQTLPGLINRLMLSPRFSMGLQSAPDLPIVRVVTSVAEAIVLAITLWFTRGRLESRRSLRFALEFSAWLVAMLVISPIAWDHYFTWLLLPITVILAALLNSQITNSRAAALVIVLAIGLWLISIPSETFLRYPEAWQRSPLLYASLLILAILFERLESTRSRGEFQVPARQSPSVPQT
jgi:Glycosyltransferase family 87